MVSLILRIVRGLSSRRGVCLGVCVSVCLSVCLSGGWWVVVKVLFWRFVRSACCGSCVTAQSCTAPSTTQSSKVALYFSTKCLAIWTGLQDRANAAHFPISSSSM